MKARSYKPKEAPMLQPGYDGAAEFAVDVHLSRDRSGARIIRCRPGTFEWRYGRETADASLYHAGIKFAGLWEKAGTAAASSPDLEFTGTGQWKGIPDGRVIAMSAIKAARLDIGRWGTSRLVDYCVMGTPASEIAVKYGMDERGMSFVLYEDLQACARHFSL